MAENQLRPAIPLPAESRRMSPPSKAALDLAESLISRVKEVILDAETQTRPLEIDPFRSRLFELFVTAEGAGFTGDGAEPDLSCDGLARTLAVEWNLQTVTADSVSKQTKIAPEHLSKLRLLWSFMRMWMEWTYAWERYAEFKFPPSDDVPAEETTAEWREVPDPEQ